MLIHWRGYRRRVDVSYHFLPDSSSVEGSAFLNDDNVDGSRDLRGYVKSRILLSPETR